MLSMYKSIIHLHAVENYEMCRRNRFACELITRSSLLREEGWYSDSQTGQN